MADEVPMFDDIPSFDDLPDAAEPPAAASAVPRFDDIPAFDDLPSGVTPEGPAATFGRKAAHSVGPGLASLAGIGAGAKIGAAAGPWGALAGGLVGGIAAGVGAHMAQEAALPYVGIDDAEQQRVNAEENPWSSIGGEIAGSAVGLSPVAGASKLAPAMNQIVQRGAGAAFGGGVEGAQQAYEGEFDARRLAANVVAGAALPGVNRVGDKFVNAGGRMVPGRPGVAANPEAAQSHADVDDPEVEVNVAGSSLAQPQPPATGETTGNPQSAPQRSARTYTKGVDPAMQGRYAEALADPEVMRELAFEEGVPESQMREIAKANYQPGILTQGDHDPATIAAAQAANPGPEVIPGFDDHPSGVGQPAPQRPPVQSEEGLLNGSQMQREGMDQARQRVAAQQEGQAFQPEPEMSLDPNRPAAPQVVDAGFPEAGAPLAVGENEAVKMPPKAAAAIAKSKGAEVPKPMPEIKGAPHPSPTEGQAEAGNYLKGRTHDFGKPMKVETEAGGTRKGKGPDGVEWEHTSPYDYGYYNKTKGADKDHIDWARPRAEQPEHGDKHFIIDQRNAETGKFDEHKVFNYYKDEAAARAHYEAGFGDGKGAERLGAITEVSRGDLVKFLQKHTSRAATKPYGKFEGEATPAKTVGAKPAVERAVIKDLIEKKRAAGDEAAAKAIESAPEETLLKAAEGKRLRKYGVGTGNSAGYPVEGVFTSDGQPVTANTKAKAAERSAAHKKVVDWYEKTAPKVADENDGALLDRLKQAAPNIEGWKPSHKPKEWMLAREAQKVLMKPTPGNIKKFREAERLLRSTDEAADNYRSGNRIDADIEKSRRSGDDAVGRAEQALATQNTVEDDMIAKIDANRAAQRKLFDTPHEEAESMVKPTPVKSRADLKELPSKTVDVKDSSLAKIDTRAISAAEMRKAEAAKLAGRKSVKPAGVESEGAAAPVKQIKVHDPAEMQRMIDAGNKAQKKVIPDDILPAAAEPRASKGVVDLFEKFANDERGSLDLNAIKQAWNNAMAGIGKALKKSEPESYRSMPLRTRHAIYVQSLSDDLHKLANADKVKWTRLVQKLAAIPKELNNPATLEQVYHARDADSAHFPLPAGQTGTHIDNLPPAIKALYDKHLKPIFDANDHIVKLIRAVDDKRIGPDVLSHISRITSGDTKGFDILHSTNDPTQPAPQYNALSTNANAAKDRKFYALVDNATGRRHVIAPTDEGFMKWERYKREKIKDPNFEFEDGAIYTAGPNTYTMRQATTKEIMANARGEDKKPMKYYTNASFSAAVANAQLGAMQRHLTELARLTNTTEFKNLSSKNPQTKVTKGYDTTNLANMDGVFMHPDLKAVFDDFAGHKQNGYRQLNSSITKLLFWMPIPHINNQGTHWFVGRGWDNLSIPKNYKLFTQHLPNAIREVTTQGPYIRGMMKEGAGLIHPSVVTRDMLGKIAKNVGLEIERKPDQWDAIAGKLGVPLRKLHNAIYNNFSAPLMWASSDVFLVARVMELEAQGHSLKKAIVEAERDIPNYRLPHVVGSDGPWGRMLAKTVGDPAKVAFGRYHYGMINSYANILRDAFSKDKTLGDRVDAAGKLMAMGILATLIYPYLYDQAAKAITGNDDAKAARRGPTTVPYHIEQAAEGKQDIMSAVRGVATVPPLLSGGLQLLSNKDFRGKSIVEPGDVAAAVKGSPAAAARAGVQLGEHVARVAISPYNTLAGAIQKEAQNPSSHDKHPGARAAIAAGKAVRDMTLDIKDPSEKNRLWQRKSPILNDQAARSRFKRGGSGPLEGLVGKGTGYR